MLTVRTINPDGDFQGKEQFSRMIGTQLYKNNNHDDHLCISIHTVLYFKTGVISLRTEVDESPCKNPSSFQGSRVPPKFCIDFAFEVY